VRKEGDAFALTPELAELSDDERRDLIQRCEKAVEAFEAYPENLQALCWRGVLRCDEGWRVGNVGINSGEAAGQTNPDYAAAGSDESRCTRSEARLILSWDSFTSSRERAVMADNSAAAAVHSVVQFYPDDARCFVPRTGFFDFL